MTSNQFKIENKYFNSALSEWLQMGMAAQFVVLDRTTVIDFYHTAEEASQVVEQSDKQLFSAIIQQEDTTNMVFLGETS